MSEKRLCYDPWDGKPGPTGGCKGCADLGDSWENCDYGKVIQYQRQGAYLLREWGSAAAIRKVLEAAKEVTEDINNDTAFERLMDAVDGLKGDNNG